MASNSAAATPASYHVPVPHIQAASMVAKMRSSGDWPGRYRKDYAVNPAIKRGEV
jgi:hypothetical protein